MFGLLNLDKPAGMTSRDVVNRVQRLVKPHKVGHAGTLDPLATGVLVVAVGPATRLIEYVQQMEKTYRGTFLLGRTSDTEDIKGNVVELLDAPVPTEQQFIEELPQFVGTIQQRPPAFSALKVAGQRAYDLARRGEAVELAPRAVEIYAIDVLRYAYPELELRVRCGSGTYIRSLGRDLARAVGTDAVMSALRREAIGPLLAEGALPLDLLTRESIEQYLQPAALAVAGMPAVVVNPQEIARLSQGQAICGSAPSASAEFAALDSAGQLVAILVRADGEHLRPNRYFSGSAAST